MGNVQKMYIPQLIDENEPALQLMHNLVLNPIQHIEIDTRLDEVELILNKTHHKVSFDSLFQMVLIVAFYDILF